MDALFAAADEMSGIIDRQTYDQFRGMDFDAPDDAEFSIILTAKEIRAFDRALNEYRSASGGR